MPYEPLEWSNLPAKTTRINAARLAHMETQYQEVVDDIGTPGTPVGDALSATFVAVRTADGQPLAPGTVVVITLDKTLAEITASPVAEIADITFEEA